MALQMRDAKPAHIADLRGFDGIELVLAGKHFLHLIELRLIAAMDRHALVPALAVGVEVILFVHDRLPWSPRAHSPPPLRGGVRGGGLRETTTQANCSTTQTPTPALTGRPSPQGGG